MLNLMEDDRNRQVSEEQKYQAGTSEKPVESVYKPRALIFERQPTRYAWFAVDDMKERDGIWKKMDKHNNIPQNRHGTQRLGNVPVQSFKKPCNALPQNKLTEYNADKSQTNIICATQRTRKRNIQKTNETPIRYEIKRIHLKEENIATKENQGQEIKCQDKNEITKDEVTSSQVAKTPGEEGLKFEDDMEHRKSPPFTEAQNYLEHNDITNTITSAGQHSEAHVFGAKSSDTSDKPTETKYDLGKQDALKLSASPEPADINNHFMTASDAIPIDKSGKTSSLQSQCLEANKVHDKNLLCNDAKENRIFGRTSDNLSTLNTEAVKFSFGTNITDTPYKDAIVFSAKDRQQKNQNEADVLKQTTLKLRKPEEITHRNITDINECNDSGQAVAENALSNEYLSLEEKNEIQIKQNSGKETFYQSVKPSRRDKYGFQRQNDVTVRQMVEKEQTSDSDNQKISNERDMATLSLIPDTNAESAETICKTCLALQEAEKSNYKSFSVVIDTLTEVNQKLSKGYTLSEVNQKPSKGDTLTEVNQKPSKGDTLTEVNKKPSKGDTLTEVNRKPSKGDFICDEKQEATKSESEKFTEESVCEKTEPYDFTQNKINNISEIEKQGSSAQKDLYTTKPEQVLTDDPIVSSSADKRAGEVHTESSTKPCTLTEQGLVEPKCSVSSENSQAVENDSEPSADSLVTEQQTKVKKQKRNWFVKLFSRLHKRKIKKVVECDVVSTPPENCS